MTAEARTETIATYERLNAALDGEVIPDIGQITPVEKRVFRQAIRAGKLASWRGKWFPVAGASFGIGPDKTCYSTPEVAEYFRSLAASFAKSAAFAKKEAA